MKKLVLSLQHLLVMFGATVLVPILTGFNPSVAIFCAGIGTLIFHFCTQGKVPVFLGSSFAFIPVILSAKEAFNGDLAYAQGGIVVAGAIYILISFLVKLVGIDEIKKYFPPQVTGAMIAVIGLNLIPTAFDMASNQFLIAFITLGVALLTNKFAKGFLKQLSILVAVFVGYTISLILGQVDISTISQASLFSIPSFTFPKFSPEATIIVAPVVISVL